MTDDRGPVNVARFEIIDLDPATRERWKVLGQSVKRVTNCFWRNWFVAHVQAGNAKRVRQYFEELRAWHQAGGEGACPICEVQCLTNEMTRVIRARVKSEYPELNSACIELILQKLGRQVFRSRSSKGKAPRWQRILADDGEYPNHSSPLPIPFAPRNCDIIVPATDKEPFQLQVRLDRIEEPGKKKASSTKDVCQLKGSNYTDVLWKIVNGELIFAGSDLVYRESKNKWFAHIRYRKLKGETPELDPGRVAFLYPARKQPWWLRIDGYHHYVGGRHGQHVAYTRQQLLTDRWGRQEAYKYASSARKGHGCDRAVGRVHMLQSRWQDFVKTANRQVAFDAVKKCVEHKCGRLVYFQPMGSVREGRFLHTAGKNPDRPDNTGWDWSQLASILSYKCQQLGIDFEPHRIGESKLPSARKSRKSHKDRKGRKGRKGKS